MKLLVGNWKMAPASEKEAIKLAKQTLTIARTHKKALTTVVCPPHIFIAPIAKQVKGLLVGAQTVSGLVGPAETGLVSAPMLASYKTQYVIVGHSESRARGDTNVTVRLQIDRLLEKKLIPIICVGEDARDQHGWYLSTVKDQIESALSGIPRATLKRVVIAYEPVWAIGVNAKREATPVECNEMVIFIRKVVSDMYDDKAGNLLSILYGGSVNEQNAALFTTEGGADGLLVGRASLDTKKLTLIAKRVADLS